MIRFLSRGGWRAFVVLVVGVGVSFAEALRQAQLKMLREGISRGLVFEDQGDAKRRAPPKFWAASILSGDWR